MIKAVIFDMDDLMINSDPVHILAHNKFLKRYGYSLSSMPEKIRNESVGKRIIDDIAVMKDYFNIEKNAEELFSERHKIFMELIEKKLEPMPGLFELINILEKEKLDLAIGSSGTRDYINLVLKKINLNDKFKAIVSGEDVKNGKPDPEVFLLAAKRLDRHPEECLVLEDATNGIAAARNADMRVIAVESPYTLKQDLSKADLVVDSLDKITIEMIKGL